ncbi:hypothetical protein TNCV_1927091 [Trichonephila clavipes]|nr:hypothetical protein TNCV_1927091 [Trichonephila clavipes]
MTNCERLQLVNQELRKFSIMLSNVTHTIDSIAPYTSDDDPELADLYTRQAYFDERQPLTISDSKRKESEDGFISPTSKQTVKRQQLEFRNFDIEINNRFEQIRENDTDIAGHFRNTINFIPSTTKVNTNTNNDNTNPPNTLPPPVFLKIEKYYMEQLRTLTEIIPTLRSKKTGELIKLYNNNFDEYGLLNNTVEKLKYQFFVIKSKHERPIKVVVKGLPKDTETQQIHENLMHLGYTVDRVTQLVGRITKQTLPVFLITLSRNINNLQIFHLTQLCYLTVRVEGYDV